ncbi:hypothetical protein IscW_ISCW001341 [Ixodes scapularis]|uniref:Uncharacterized protein n=1 Tax=Ixodes scapularis TaxID=6945 RepID=B7P1Q3_IXOSC|nr:hypothetical protein IscW_ISCW001341 [Ixodes scapularis]|eukprot:XP_002433461.1 hypothetical protein IscW_ISCW001341 [Ixodes scapularis]
MELSTYCLHESGWRFVTAPGEASLQCLPCCAQQLLDVRDVSWLRRSGLARALTEAIATVPRGAFRACSALPVWALVARALVGKPDDPFAALTIP